MKKFENIKNNIKETLDKIKNYIKENLFIIMSWCQFVLTIALTILLICSLIMTNNLSKRLDDISKQNTSALNSTSSQVSSESDTTVSSEVESTVESTPSTSSTPSTPSNITSSDSTESNPSTVTLGTTTDLDLLACVIYQEAGGNGSCDNCRRYVADIVLNRVADPRFPNTIKEVLTAAGQYGRYYYTGVVWPSRARNAHEQDAVARAYRIAEEVLNGQHSELYGNGYVWQAGFKQGSSQIKCCGHYYGK